MARYDPLYGAILETGDAMIQYKAEDDRGCLTGSPMIFQDCPLNMIIVNFEPMDFDGYSFPAVREAEHPTSRYPSLPLADWLEDVKRRGALVGILDKYIMWGAARLIQAYKNGDYSAYGLGVKHG